MDLKEIKEHEHSPLWNTEADDMYVSLYPNPSSGSINISFELKKATIAKVMICDQKGIIIKTIAERYLEKGKHVFSQETSIPQGNYFIVIKKNDQLHTEQLIISH